MIVQFISTAHYPDRGTVPRSRYVEYPDRGTGTSMGVHFLFISYCARRKYFVQPMLYFKVISRKFPVNSPFKLKFSPCTFFSTYIQRFTYQYGQKKAPYSFGAIFWVHTPIGVVCHTLFIRGK